MTYSKCAWSGCRQLLTILVFLVTVTPSLALVVASEEDTRVPPTTAQIPDGDPGFVHVGERGTASAVYIGYGWMLTAAHVEAGNTFFYDSNTGDYTAEYGYLPSTVTTIGNADLRLYRLSTIPDLPALTIASSSNSVGDEVVMIGRCNKFQEAGWDRISYQNWVEVSPPENGQYQGFKFISTTRDIRWGTNQIDVDQESIITESYLVGTKTTTAFSTKFNEGIEYEAQTHFGDSGGAVFYNNNGEWELNGIMIAMDQTPTDYPSYPPDVMLFGNDDPNDGIPDLAYRISYSAKLSIYRSYILDVIAPLAGDANLDGIVNSSDLGILSTYYGTSGDPGEYMWNKGDFNGDSIVNVTDLGMLSSSWQNTAEWYNPPVAHAVPEPSVLVMAVLGVFAFLCRCRQKSIR